MKPPLIVAIDGPSGVGKSTTSMLLAKALGVPHIDTGAMYRAIALKAMQEGVSLEDEERLADLTARAVIGFVREGNNVQVLLDGVDVSKTIRSSEAGMAASRVSAVPAVRRRLVKLQQEMGRTSGGVLEGRDIGTKVFPETPHKFFLTARPETRAERRKGDLEARGATIPVEEILADINQRDLQDSSRADSPLRFDDSYVVIDTSDLPIDQVVEQMVAGIRARSAGIA